jgi:CRP-like cAMP-binding protein
MNQPTAILRQLQAIPIFDCLSDVQLRLLAKSSRERIYRKGMLVFLKGDQPSGLFAVISGTLKMACQSPRGDEKIIDLPASGQVFGEAALLLGSPYPYYAAALGPARLLHIDGSALHELIGASSAFAQRMMSHIAQGIATVLDDLEDYCLRDPRQRLARFLLDRTAADNGAAITFPVQLHVFASRLGMTPEALSRALRDLREAGAIEVCKWTTRVINREKLAVLVDPQGDGPQCDDLSDCSHHPVA